MEFITSLFAPLLSFVEGGIDPNWLSILEDGEFKLNAIARLIKWLHSLVGDYGVTVIIFTVFLKVLTLPLDIWQKYATKKSGAKMAVLQPQLDKLDKQYAQDQRRLNEEKQKLYKKQGYSAFASCLPLIVTMVVFMVMFGGLNSYSAYINVENYAKLEYQYEAHYEQEYERVYQECINNSYEESEARRKTETDAVVYAQVKVGEFYSGEGESAGLKESFLWIKNIWRPDTWAKSIADYNDFKNGGMGLKALGDSAPDVYVYNIIREAVLMADAGYFANVEDGEYVRDGNGEIKNAGWNGLLILPLLAVALSFLSTFLTQKQTKKSGAADPAQQSQKTMMFIMPIMMGVFGFMYTSAFAVYMVTNYALTLIINLLTNKPIDAAIERKMSQQEQETKASYMR